MKQIAFSNCRAAGLLLSVLCATPNFCDGQAGGAPSTKSEVTEQETCGNNLKQIYEAIQAYRRDHKDLPNWLSELVPQYLADPAVLTCPVTKRTGKDIPYQHLADPKITTSYVYEFCDGETGTIWGGGKMKMRQFKMLQMGVVGGSTPIVRCLLHRRALNIGFDGKFFESPWNWEELFQDVVDLDALSPEKLLGRIESNPERTRRTPPEIAPDTAGISESEQESLLGKPAPEVRLELLGGGQFELASHKNKNIVILDFWATWCGPCRTALPVLTEVAEEYRARGVILRPINLREPSETVLDYLNRTGLKIDVPLDPEGKTAKLFGVNGIPHTVVVNKEGFVQAVNVGYSPQIRQRLREELDSLLAVKNLAAPAATK